VSFFLSLFFFFKPSSKYYHLEQQQVFGETAAYSSPHNTMVSEKSLFGCYFQKQPLRRSCLSEIQTKTFDRN